MTDNGNPEEYSGELPEDFSVIDIVQAGKTPEVEIEDMAARLKLGESDIPAFASLEEVQAFTRRVGIGILERLFEMGALDATILKARLIELENDPKELDPDLLRVATAFDDERSDILSEEDPDIDEIKRLKRLNDFSEVVGRITIATVSSALSTETGPIAHIENIIDEAEQKTDLSDLDTVTKNALRMIIEELRQARGH